MALLKKGFIKFGHEDVRTEYKLCDTTHIKPDDSNTDLVNGPLKSKKCFPAGSVIKFDETTHKAISAVANDVTSGNINTSVFLLAEDFYSDDNGFVYYIVDNVKNLEDRA